MRLKGLVRSNSLRKGYYINENVLLFNLFIKNQTTIINSLNFKKNTLQYISGFFVVAVVCFLLLNLFGLNLFG